MILCDSFCCSFYCHRSQNGGLISEESNSEETVMLLNEWKAAVIHLLKFQKKKRNFQTSKSNTLNLYTCMIKAKCENMCTWKNKQPLGLQIQTRSHCQYQLCSKCNTAATTKQQMWSPHMSGERIHSKQVKDAWRNTYLHQLCIWQQACIR